MSHSTSSMWRHTCIDASAMKLRDNTQIIVPQVRALVEGQFASMRGHAERIGLKTPPSRVIATGGGSANLAMLQNLSQVFGCAVYTSSSTGMQSDPTVVSAKWSV